DAGAGAGLASTAGVGTLGGGIAGTSLGAAGGDGLAAYGLDGLSAGGGLTAATAATGAAAGAGGLSFSGIDPMTGLPSTGSGGTGTYNGSGVTPSTSGTSGVPTGTGTALSRILDGSATTTDWTSLLGGLGAAGLGIAGSNAQTNALQNIYNQQRADRAPALASYNNALQNPNSWYQSAPAMGAANAASSTLSMQGNPADNPGLTSKLAAYNLGGYTNYLNGLEPAAFGGQQTQAQLGTNIAQSSGGVYNALGSGLATLTNPVQSPAQQLAAVLSAGKGL